MIQNNIIHIPFALSSISSRYLLWIVWQSWLFYTFDRLCTIDLPSYIKDIKCFLGILHSFSIPFMTLVDIILPFINISYHGLSTLENILSSTSALLPLPMIYFITHNNSSFNSHNYFPLTTTAIGTMLPFGSGLWMIFFWCCNVYVLHNLTLTSMKLSIIILNCFTNSVYPPTSISNCSLSYILLPSRPEFPATLPHSQSIYLHVLSTEKGFCET